MGDHLIFDSPATAAAALADLEARAIELWEAAGYEVNREQRIVYGKNAATGETDYSASGTTAWDTVRKHPTQDLWAFCSPRVKYAAYFDALMAGYAFTEADLTPDWFPSEASEEAVLI